MRLTPYLNCEGCFKPVARRLALSQPMDKYECYAESYIKCFWGLCDHHKSNDTFTSNKSDGEVITEQPKREEILFKNCTVIKEISVRKLN